MPCPAMLWYTPASMGRHSRNDNRPPRDSSKTAPRPDDRAPVIDYELITDENRFRRVVERIAGESRIGFDLESNGFFRYPERICLIQLSTSGSFYLIDPLAIDDMSPLGEVLANPGVETVLHSGDHDIRSLDRDWGLHVGNLFDTSIAAAFVGSERLGLASTLQDFLDVTIPKEKSIQRSDWSIRPLSNTALEYAAGDVRYLFDLRDKLVERLRALDRISWVREECERLAEIRYNPPDPELAVFAVKGSRDLDGRGLAILKALMEYRERHALRLGRPHFRVIPDAALLSLAAEPKSDLRDVRGLGMFARGRLAAGIRDSIKKGRATEPLQRPRQPRGRRFSRAERAKVGQRLDKLKAWRTEHSQKLSLAVGLLWPMASLQRIASFPDELEIELQAPEIRRWQRDEFEESLRALVT
ncbi:MAG: HRDC domain-containing protein [Chloroflexi bacterium]|nr:HRDC domain-containing protein [Chloroflexota bacterium]